jgi:hypothetical protein
MFGGKYGGWNGFRISHAASVIGNGRSGGGTAVAAKPDKRDFAFVENST